VHSDLTRMPGHEETLVELIERIVFAGVALTSRALSEATAEPDLTVPQWRVLAVLGEDGEHGEGIRLTDVAARIGVTLPATSRQLRRLERRSLIELHPDERDRRVVRARLTRDGERVRSTIVAYRMRAIAGVTDSLPVSAATLTELAGVAEAFDRFR
jgi:DNA-binding MarR family transcriptional regulator